MLGQEREKTQINTVGDNGPLQQIFLKIGSLSNLYFNKLKNVKEMDKFLDTSSLSIAQEFK